MAPNQPSKTYLLDTHVALWWFNDDQRFNEEQFKERFPSVGSSKFIFHQVSTWEIQIKYQLGKLLLPDHPKDFLLQAVRDSGLIYETISDEGIFFLEKLPAIHRDPFDRLLISHALINGWTILTADSQILEYPVLTEKV